MRMDVEHQAEPGLGAGRLGTFGGVFTPSLLTILGIVLFLRLGYVVGSVGLREALLVMLAAQAITLLTSLSIAAVATNLRVRGGGDYYLISRTLGPGFGAAIGLVLFFAQAVSVGFYCIGFAEAVEPLLAPGHPAAMRAIALGAIAVLGVLAWRGADLATRFQYVVMVLLCASLAAFAWGAVQRFEPAMLQANWSDQQSGVSFWVAFAIFFPAVTGFSQGVSMSGDLKSPSRSIPLGVLSAVALSALVYLGCAVLFGGALAAEGLQQDTAAMKTLAAWGPLIDAGVMAATLSSALASMMGAPRILQSVARDRLFGWLDAFERGTGAGDNPRRALVPTFAVACAVVMLGELNVVASVVSMFFLVSYGLLNYATYHEARSRSPSFRPTFRLYDRRIGLAGAGGCLAAMLAIDWRAGALAVGLVYVIYRVVEHRAGPVRWTDGRRAYHLQMAREHLLKAAAEPQHALAWRPQLLVFSDTPSRRPRLLAFARWVEGEAGLTTAVRIVGGDAPGALQRRRTEAAALAAELKAAGSSAFPLVVVTSQADAAVSAVIQAAGVGPVRVNTVVANWPVGPDKWFYEPIGVDSFGHHMTTAFRLGANLLLLDADDGQWQALAQEPAGKRVIDVWWHDSPTGELMLLLAYLMTRSAEWGGARIRVLATPDAGGSDGGSCQALEARLEEIRIPASVVALAHGNEAAALAASRGSSIVFLPFRVHRGRFDCPFGWDMGRLLARLPTTVLVLASEDVELDADPEAPAAAGTPAPDMAPADA